MCRIWTAALMERWTSTNAGTHVNRFSEYGRLSSTICPRENIPSCSNYEQTRHVFQAECAVSRHMCLSRISFSSLSSSLGLAALCCMLHPQQADTQKVQGAQNAEVISWKIDLLYKKKLESIPSSLFYKTGCDLEEYAECWHSVSPMYVNDGTDASVGKKKAQLMYLWDFVTSYHRLTCSVSSYIYMCRGLMGEKSR